MHNRHNRKGATLVELLIFLAMAALIIVPVLLVCGALFYACSDPDVSDRPSAEENAANYFAFNYPEAINVQIKCDGSDPNGTGFTKCVAGMDMPSSVGLEQHRYVALCSGNWQVGRFDQLPEPGCIAP